MTDDVSPADREKVAGATSLKDLRIFISYPHDDYDVARTFACHLKEHHATVLWDRGFAHGLGFHEQIRTQIAYAHVFMPLITPSSSEQGWVHEEIGCAMALNIPILPVAIGQPPDAMLYHLHAVWFDSVEDVNQIQSRLPPEVFLRLVERFDDPTQAIYVCAAESKDRAAMLYRYATEVRRLGHSGEVRQSSALSSFHIPAETPEHPRWELQYGPDNQCSLHHRRLLRCERLALEWHESEKGAKLVICPEVIIDQFNRRAAKARLQTLKDFLERAGDKSKSRAATSSIILKASQSLVTGSWRSRCWVRRKPGIDRRSLPGTPRPSGSGSRCSTCSSRSAANGPAQARHASARWPISAMKSTNSVLK